MHQVNEIHSFSKTIEMNQKKLIFIILYFNLIPYFSLYF
jgi:hypothetical protein